MIFDPSGHNLWTGGVDLPATIKCRRTDDVLDQTMQIENQRYRTVSQNGGSRNNLDIAIKSAQILDHGLVVAKHLINHKAIPSMLGLSYHDLLPLRAVIAQLQV